MRLCGGFVVSPKDVKYIPTCQMLELKSNVWQVGILCCRVPANGLQILLLGIR